MKHLLIFIYALALATTARAQGNEAYVQYIERYKMMAMDQMVRHKIPASITLAQGILESNAGRSMLAVEANNHFGIKVGSSWTGPYVIKPDDKANDMFRKYNTVAESYEDHSTFLHRQRYASLFDLNPFDYEQWAYGLKAAGYATNPQYPTLLINIIEGYNLTQYDRQAYLLAQGDNLPSTQTQRPGQRVITHMPHLCNDVAYVIARQGDTFESLAYEMGIKAKKLRKYNDVANYYELKDGDVVFLHKKKSHVARPLRHAYHRVEAGESVHSISQRYGVRMKLIYKWNNLRPDYRPKAGDLLLMK